jgi:hypothetical protein
MRITNWGLFLVGVYLIIVSLNTLGVLQNITNTRIDAIIGLVAGVLLLVEHWRR